MRKFKIGAVYDRASGELVNQSYYNRLIKELEEESGKPLRIVFEDGQEIEHQLVNEHDETDYGFWISTTTKDWRFDWIWE